MDAAFQSLDDFPPPSDVRRFPRRPVLFARVEFGDNAEAAGIVVNVSEGGLCVQTAKEIVGDRPLRLRVHCLPSGWVEARGRPVWQDEAKIVTGIEFVDLSEKARQEINKWLTFGTSLQELRGNWSTEGARQSRRAPADWVTPYTVASEQDISNLRLDIAAETAETSSSRHLGRGHVVFAEQPGSFGSYLRSSRLVILGIVLILALMAVWSARHGDLALRIERTLAGYAGRQKNANSSSPQPPAIKEPPSIAAVQETPVAKIPSPLKFSPVPSPPAASANAGSGMVLQVAAMNLVENANALAASLRQKNFPAFVWGRPGDLFYRVFLGPYRDGASLASAKDALKKEGVIAVEKHWTSRKEESQK
jgi:cell division septation protein DedD